MGVSDSDVGLDDYSVDREAEALERASEVAEQIVDEFTEHWRDAEVRPAATVELTAGGEDQAVFVFSLLLELDDDFDADSWPSDDVERFSTDLRSRVINTEVDAWDWLVTARVKTTSAAG